MIKVSIVEDDPRDAQMLAWALSHKEICIGQTYASCEEALKGLPQESPDVILMDVNLPGVSGIECLRKLKKMKPELNAKIVVLTGDPRRELVFEALELGADGYLTKGEALIELPRHILTVSAGGGVMSPNVLRIVMERYQEQVCTIGDARAGLSPQQDRVLSLLAEGKQYKEIAEIMQISLNTVCTHLKKGYRKLDVTRRQDAKKYFERQSD